MTRTEKQHKSKVKGTEAKSNTLQRAKAISMTCSKILRHQALNYKIPITTQGWVKVQDLLDCPALTDRSKFDPPVTFEDIVDVVREDGLHGKGRFALKLISDEDVKTAAANLTESGCDAGSPSIGSMVEATGRLLLTSPTQSRTQFDPASKNGAETQATIAHFAANPDKRPAHCLIRATQGHSMKVIESEGLLQPIRLEDPASIPHTVVHGTFYGAWNAIVSSGGLKPMGRNNVHFALGPSVAEVLATSSPQAPAGTEVNNVLVKNQVISGMRSDAQILIYVDLKRCLEDVAASGSDMKWFISDNGVVLTEGCLRDASADTTDHPSAQTTSPVSLAQTDRLVPMKYWDQVVEIKAGLGVIWKHGHGVVTELPQHLREKPLPRGKGGHGGAKVERTGRGGTKPRLKVERHDIEGDT